MNTIGTGDSVAILGTKYDSQEEAREYFENNCCTRCNRMELVFIPDGWSWVDRHRGFIPRKERIEQA